MSSPFIKNINNISRKDILMAGGKGASLGELAQAGFTVPPGFIIAASAFDLFLRDTDLGAEISAILKTAKPNDINSVEEASVEIRDLFQDAVFPEDIAAEILKAFKMLRIQKKTAGRSAPGSPRFAFSASIGSCGPRDDLLVAVRSSATAEDSEIASWAGELESYLNVDGKGMLEAVKKCWSSLFTPRAIFYRYEKKLADAKIAVAVVVQAMIQSEVSGICFTAHPVTKDRRQMVIEAGWGLGEAVVGGLITPDTYVLEKTGGGKRYDAKPHTNAPARAKASAGKNAAKGEGAGKFKIIDINIGAQKIKVAGTKAGTKKVKLPKVKGEKQKLTDKQILELAKICARIETHFKKPQDIEWALRQGRYYILQARPITTL